MSELTEQSEQPEAKQIEANKAEPKPQAQAKTPEPKPKKSGGLFWPFFIMTLILGLAGSGFYLFSQLRDKQEGLGGEVKSELAKQIKDYQSQLTAIQSQVAALQSEIAGKDERFSKTLSEFTDLHNQKLEATRKEISDKVVQVQRQLGKTRGDWLIADAEYLLSVANERLHLVGDINTTREALEAADQRLRESGDTGVIAVREQIAKDIAQVQGVKMPDLIGLNSSLKSLESEVPKLTLALPYSGKPLTSKEEAAQSTPKIEDPNDLVTGAIHELEGIVTIKHTNKPIKEILTQEQAEFIREQLKLKLEMVKLSLLQQNDTLYQSHLADAKNWVMEHFNDTETTKLFLEEVSKLQGIKLREQMPDISISLKMLRDVAKLRVETDKALSSDEEEKPEQNKGSAKPETGNKEGEKESNKGGEPAGSADAKPEPDKNSKSNE